MNLINDSALPKEVKNELLEAWERVNRTSELALSTDLATHTASAADQYKQLIAMMLDAATNLPAGARETFVGATNELIVKPQSQPRPVRNVSAGGAVVSPGCSCGGSFVRDEVLCTTMCKVCGLSAEMFDLQISNKKLPRRTQDTSSVKEAETLRKMLLAMQGMIPSEQLRKDAEEEWGRIEKQFMVQFYSADTMTLEKTREVLKKLELRRFCKIAPYFYHRYTRKPPLKLTIEEDATIQSEYQVVLQYWQNAAIEGIKNLPHCGLIAYEIVSLMNLSHERRNAIQDTIYQLEPNTVEEFRLGFWRAVCDGTKHFVYRYA